MASDVSICNLALQKLGASEQITSLTQDSTNARACNLCFEDMRDAELRAHPWSFARKWADLTADSDAPVSDDYAYAFTLPTDCLKVLPPNRNDLDWQIADGQILTNDGTSIQIRYVRRVTDANAMDPVFRDMLACRIAKQICKKVTGSTSAVDDVDKMYRMARLEARRANAFEQTSDEAPEDTWLTARL